MATSMTDSGTGPCKWFVVIVYFSTATYVSVVITRPAGVLFRSEITAGGWRRLTSDQALRALDGNGWIRYSGPLHRGVTQDENGDIMMTVTEEP